LLKIVHRFRNDVHAIRGRKQLGEDETKVNEERACQGGDEVIPEFFAGELEHLALRPRTRIQPITVARKT